MNSGCAGKTVYTSTRAIPERIRGVFTTRRYTNPRWHLPNLTVVILIYTGSIINCKFCGGDSCGFVQLSSSSSVSADLTYKVSNDGKTSRHHHHRRLYWKLTKHDLHIEINKSPHILYNMWIIKLLLKSLLLMRGPVCRLPSYLPVHL